MTSDNKVGSVVRDSDRRLLDCRAAFVPTTDLSGDLIEILQWKTKSSSDAVIGSYSIVRGLFQ